MLNSQFHISVKNVQKKKIHCYFNFAATKGDIMYVKYLLVIC